MKKKKIIKFKSKKEKAEEWFFECFGKHFDKCQKAAIVMQCEDESVVIGYYGCKYIDRIMLKSYLEYDIFEEKFVSKFIK